MSKSNTFVCVTLLTCALTPFVIFFSQGVFAVTGSSTVMVVKPVLKEGKYYAASMILPCLFLGFVNQDAVSIGVLICPTKYVPGCLAIPHYLFDVLVFNLDGSMKEGPWSFRFAYLCTTLPLYSCVLLTVATVAGRRPYFKKVVIRMWGRFLPKKVIQRFQ